MCLGFGNEINVNIPKKCEFEMDVDYASICIWYEVDYVV